MRENVQPQPSAKKQRPQTSTVPQRATRSGVNTRSRRNAQKDLAAELDIKPYPVIEESKEPALVRKVSSVEEEDNQIDALLMEQVLQEDLAQRGVKLPPTPSERVQASEICLFCNLYDLFTKYSVNEFGPIDASATSSENNNKVLQPRQVRHALSQLNFESVGGQDF